MIPNGEDTKREVDSGHELPAAEAVTTESPVAEENVDDGGQPDANSERALLTDRLARLQAEFDNARKRTAREQEEFKEFALAGALRSLLPVLDNLDRALEAPLENPQQLRTGVELIQRQLHDAFGKLGVESIRAAGEPFDPNLHQAIEVVDTNDAASDDIVQELQPGYRLRDRVLRPALVRVARARRSA